MTDCSDEQLMTLVSNHDASAFENLFRRYEYRVFAFFYRLFRDAEEASEGTQETFLKLWKARAQYAPTGKFSTYLFQIAKNHFLQQVRSRSCREGLSTTVDVEQSSRGTSSADGPYDQAVAGEIRSAITRAVAQLPEIHRLVYVMSEQQHMSYDEIAEVLECPVGTVSSRKVKAIRKLRTALRPLHDELGGVEAQAEQKRSVGGKQR
jgi:RNA polymerase sigma-70 factor (ECF subfamily)